MSILNYLIEVIDELVDITVEVNESTPLADLGLASLDYIEVQVLIKNKYGVIVNADLFGVGGIETLGDLINYIDIERHKINQAAEA